MPIRKPKLKVAFSGSRTLDLSIAQIEKAVRDSGFYVGEVIHGECRGPDLVSDNFAKRHRINVKTFPADWQKFGRSAGPRRNAEMADYADVCIAFWDGESHGTASMIAEMNARNKPVFVVRIPQMDPSTPPF